jgi:hypothetical protein
VAGRIGFDVESYVKAPLVAYSACKGDSLAATLLYLSSSLFHSLHFFHFAHPHADYQSAASDWSSMMGKQYP